MAILISFSGLPGVGKTSIARELSKLTKAVHLRVDSIEAAMKNSVLKIHPAEDAGYLAVAAVAADNLNLGLDVIADTVNPLEVSRQLWVETAASAKAALMNVEIVCLDTAEHKRRVETRASDIDGLVVPDWNAVISRQYQPWARPPLTLDSSRMSITECASKIIEEMASIH